MEKFESFYKEKFQGFESEPLPDAFDRIQKSMNTSGETNAIKKNSNYLSKNSYWLLKISLSLNVLLLGAMLFLHNPETKTDSIADKKIETSSTLPLNQENTIENTKSIEALKNNNETKKKNAVTTISSTYQLKTITDTIFVKSPTIIEAKINEPNVSTSTINNISETKPIIEKKKKSAIDQYYDQNAATLKDSSVQLFRKK